jgi:flavin-dependent dehydrogenase
MNEAMCDALVVGDGPAGSIAALTLRRAGLRCTMLAPPMLANQRGAIESVPPLVPLLLEAAGLAGHQFAGAIAGRFGGMVSDGAMRLFGRDAGPAPAPRDEGWHVDRAQFDHVLLNHTLEQGVTLQRDRVATASCATDGVVVETATTRHRARWLVDASGRSGVLQRLLGLAAVTRGPRMLAWRGIARLAKGSAGAGAGALPQEEDTRPSMPRFETSGSGWLWQAPLDNGSLAWTWAGEENALPPEIHSFAGGNADVTGNISGSMSSNTSSTMSAIDTSGARGFDVSWRLVRPAAGAAYRIVGDAAAMLDPRSGQGVLFALSSALAAARSIVAVEQAPHLRALEAAGYDAFVAAEFRRKSDELMRRMPASANAADISDQARRSAV